MNAPFPPYNVGFIRSALQHFDGLSAMRASAPAWPGQTRADAEDLSDLYLDLCHGLAQLSVLQRNALLLHLARGFSAADAAGCLGLRRDYLIRLVERGLRKLCALLNGRGRKQP